MNDPDAVFVLYPNQFGELDVVSIGDLIDALVSTDEEDLDEVVGTCSINMVKLTPEAVAKVRQLNLTQDSDAYWSRDTR
jgi:hypothetical protein